MSSVTFGNQSLCNIYIFNITLRYLLFSPLEKSVYLKKSLINTVNIPLRSKRKVFYRYIFSTACNQGFTNFNILILMSWGVYIQEKTEKKVLTYSVWMNQPEPDGFCKTMLSLITQRESTLSSFCVSSWYWLVGMVVFGSVRVHLIQSWMNIGLLLRKLNCSQPLSASGMCSIVPFHVSRLLGSDTGSSAMVLKTV